MSFAKLLWHMFTETKSLTIGQLECPQAKWLIGWSRGRETLKNGVYDTLKGSYYVNCAFYKVVCLLASYRC